jgi:hypothetical protein
MDMIQVLMGLIGKVNGITLVKNIFIEIEDFVEVLNDDLLKDKNDKNAIIDAICEILQKQKTS